MMAVVVALAAVALAAVAAAGVMRPFGRGGPETLDLSDPLEDERGALFRALRDLDRDRAGGLLVEDDYRMLRAETEARAVAVLRALEARDRAGDLPAGLRDMRGAPAPDGEVRPRRAPRRILPAVLAGVAVVAVAAPLLAGAVRTRSPGESITGAQSGAAGPLAFFEDRVRDHPDDIAARLDLADRYLEAGDVDRAVPQYLAALEIDPDNPEARATLGFLLYRAGRPDEGLAEVNRALRASPADPEALYFKGVILLEGLDRPAEAAAAFRAYLEAAPFGARRAEVQGLLEKAEERGSKGSTGSTGSTR